MVLRRLLQREHCGVPACGQRGLIQGATDPSETCGGHQLRYHLRRLTPRQPGQYTNTLTGTQGPFAYRWSRVKEFSEESMLD